MKKLRIYLDTSVINFLFADDVPDFKQATIDFFENYSQLYELYISDIVIFEIEKSKDVVHRNKLISVVSKHGIKILPDDSIKEIRQLANRYVEKSVIPRAKMEDALHVAYATVYEMDILLSWNFRHLANVNKELKIQSINIEEGYRYPLRLLSPLEVLDEE
ncbi:MAG: hypothetical protein NTZ51_09455 [Proteobacteria bacterium]|nr:hypothetical protein [Pseudomonadota bacterium]